MCRGALTLAAQVLRRWVFSHTIAGRPVFDVILAVPGMLGHASAAMTLDVYADLFDDVDAVSALDTARVAALVSKPCPNQPGTESRTSAIPALSWDRSARK